LKRDNEPFDQLKTLSLSKGVFPVAIRLSSPKSCGSGSKVLSSSELASAPPSTAFNLVWNPAMADRITVREVSRTPRWGELQLIIEKYYKEYIVNLTADALLGSPFHQNTMNFTY
jgi:hypothetical protein